MMSFVGREYAAADFRLIMVGMDHGDKIGNDYGERRVGIENYYQTKGCRFNPHYRYHMNAAK